MCLRPAFETLQLFYLSTRGQCFPLERSSAGALKHLTQYLWKRVNIPQGFTRPSLLLFYSILVLFLLLGGTGIQCSLVAAPKTSSQHSKNASILQNCFFTYVQGIYTGKTFRHLTLPAKSPSAIHQNIGTSRANPDCLHFTPNHSRKIRMKNIPKHRDVCSHGINIINGPRCSAKNGRSFTRE